MWGSRKRSSLTATFMSCSSRKATSRTKAISYYATTQSTTPTIQPELFEAEAPAVTTTPSTPTGDPDSLRRKDEKSSKRWKVNTCTISPRVNPPSGLLTLVNCQISWTFVSQSHVSTCRQITLRSWSLSQHMHCLQRHNPA
jgi:hypothetical protein